MKNKQTAVEWLFEKITQNGEIRWRGTQYVELFQQDKAMEKEQIIDAWNDGYEKGLRVREEKIINPVFDAETYYDDTYGN